MIANELVLLARPGFQRLAKPPGLIRNLDRVIRIQREDAEVTAEIYREIRFPFRQCKQAVEELGFRMSL